MKIALLADIHGNDLALACVLRAAREAGAERLFIAGDFVGYYYGAKAVLDLLDDWDWIAVRGNHEDMMRDWAAGRDHDAISARYGSGQDVACRELPPTTFDRLVDLPERREAAAGGRTALICHGAPWDHEAYVYPDAPADVVAKCAAEGQDLVVFGHSHYPVLWHEGGCIVVNPGSVGQPRDRRPGACWALWDTASHAVTLHRESYDAAALIAEARRRDPQLPYLWKVLTRTEGSA
ncbi:MAG TPA: metallophosphoesterase [Rhodospirillaceae bacterium]|nr:transporter [Magnetovibrio sp.]HBT44425.1 metallophosphoesterase [Rhodospirillaceae bacterium]HCS70919.1 metallophosphoesterase [Rhodospirillaceae bacterium]|tara:strand:+ start:22569 stop:23276 length:708 start_codon:yes stop_codon:yes gene_type:complete